MRLHFGKLQSPAALPELSSGAVILQNAHRFSCILQCNLICVTTKSGAGKLLPVKTSAACICTCPIEEVSDVEVRDFQVNVIQPYDVADVLLHRPGVPVWTMMPALAHVDNSTLCSARAHQ